MSPEPKDENRIVFLHYTAIHGLDGPFSHARVSKWQNFKQAKNSVLGGGCKKDMKDYGTFEFLFLYQNMQKLSIMS